MCIEVLPCDVAGTTMDDEARLERRGSHGLSGWSFILRGSMRTIQSSDKVVIGTEYTDDTSM